MNTALIVIPAVVAVLTFVGYFVVRFSKNSLATQTGELLRRQNDALRQEVTDSEHRCEAKLETLRRENDIAVLDLNRQVAELRGQVNSMTPEWAAEIARHLHDLGVRG